MERHGCTMMQIRPLTLSAFSFAIRFQSARKSPSQDILTGGCKLRQVESKSLPSCSLQETAWLGGWFVDVVVVVGAVRCWLFDVVAQTIRGPLDLEGHHRIGMETHRASCDRMETALAGVLVGDSWAVSRAAAQRARGLARVPALRLLQHRVKGSSARGGRTQPEFVPSAPEG